MKIPVININKTALHNLNFQKISDRSLLLHMDFNFAFGFGRSSPCTMTYHFVEYLNTNIISYSNMSGCLSNVCGGK